jgi:pimeloyl-ACP methyl ester carboxylesterase
VSVPEAPGARLYYELRGEGPLLAVVPGAKGEADIYRDLADELSTRYQVMTYDRRGFSRSQLDGAQDYQRRLATDADDARGLIRHLGDEPATVYGNSTGALVALEVLIRHPDVVRTVIAYEPRMVRLLPDGEQWVAFFQWVYDTIARGESSPPSSCLLRAQGSREARTARPRSTPRTQQGSPGGGEHPVLLRA